MPHSSDNVAEDVPMHDADAGADADAVQPSQLSQMPAPNSLTEEELDSK